MVVFKGLQILKIFALLVGKRHLTTQLCPAVITRDHERKLHQWVSLTKGTDSKEMKSLVFNTADTFTSVRLHLCDVFCRYFVPLSSRVSGPDRLKQTVETELSERLPRLCG